MPDNWLWYYCCIEGLGDCFAQLPEDVSVGEPCMARHITQLRTPPGAPPGTLALVKFIPIAAGMIRDEIDVVDGALLWLADPTQKLDDDLCKLWGKVQVVPAGTLLTLDKQRKRKGR